MLVSKTSGDYLSSLLVWRYEVVCTMFKLEIVHNCYTDKLNCK